MLEVELTGQSDSVIAESCQNHLDLEKFYVVNILKTKTRINTNRKS